MPPKMALTNPSEIARETLKQLAVRRLAPSPDNYRALYDEISGESTPPVFPVMPLRQIQRILPAQTPEQKRLMTLFDAAITQQSWAALQNVMVGYARLGLAMEAIAGEPDAITCTHLPSNLAENLARLIDHLEPALGEDDARLHDMAVQLRTFLRDHNPPVSTSELMLGNFSHRLSFAMEDQIAIRATLLGLLHLIFENIGALSNDDQWLQGQVEALMRASTPPLTLRRLDDVHRRLKDVIFKQSQAKESALQAQAQMRELLATFIERLAQMDASSSNYSSQMEGYAERIGQAKQLDEIGPLLEEVITTTRAMALASRISHSELLELRERADAKHNEIERLRQELDQASAQARHDPLTGSLNRKGFDEAMEREVSRAQRQGVPLCVALLDIDDFKSINDRLGHASGDQALVHLADVTREVMRPQDQLARYGGEEFVIILPDTELDAGVQAMRRLQRELTTRYFLQGSERVLITFSAGVAQVDETLGSAEALRRADQGMYLAKRSGKNRVVAA